MNFVLDTNAVSEFRKPRPNAGLLRWQEAQDAARLFVTTVTMGEVWQGFHSLPTGHSDYASIKAFANDLARRYRVLNLERRCGVE